jgi:hypothetical protein
MRGACGDVLRLMVALVLIGTAQPALSAGMPSAFAGAGRIHTTVAAPAASLTPKQRAAAQRLAVAARNLHRTVDKFVRTGFESSFVYEIDLLSERVELMLAIRNARSVGLPELAHRYQRILDAELARAGEHRAFGGLLNDAKDYGQQVAEKAHEQDPSLPATVLGNIALNAANWYGNDALLKVTLRAAKLKRPGLYEITLKKGDDLDRRAYALYRALSVGSRKTARDYGGREGLHELPDAKGGFNGGLMGFRRAVETGSDSPAIDINLNGRVIKIHVRH